MKISVPEYALFGPNSEIRTTWPKFGKCGFLALSAKKPKPLILGKQDDQIGIRTAKKADA